MYHLAHHWVLALVVKCPFGVCPFGNDVMTPDVRASVVVSDCRGHVQGERKRQFPNVSTISHQASDLRQYLDDAMWRNRHAKYLWAAMTHLTPSTISAILNPSGGFAKLSDKIAKKVVSTVSTRDYPPLSQCQVYILMQVTKWYRDDWWNAANIVASDYVLGNNLVEESIRANRKRKKCRSIVWFGI